MKDQKQKARETVKKWVTKGLAGIVAFSTTYALIVPAVAVDTDSVEDDPGYAPETTEEVVVEEPVYEPEPEVYEEPAPEPEPEVVIEEEPAAAEEAPVVFEAPAQEEQPAEEETPAPAEEPKPEETSETEPAAPAVLPAIAGKLEEKVIDDYKVTVEFSSALGFTSATTLKLEEFKKEYPGHENEPEYIEKEETYKNRLEKVEDKEEDEVKAARFFDVAFEENGAEKEAKGNVTVTYEFAEGLKLEEYQDVTVYYIDEKEPVKENQVKEVPENKLTVKETNGKVSQIKFEIKDIKNFAVVVTEEEHEETPAVTEETAEVTEEVTEVTEEAVPMPAQEFEGENRKGTVKVFVKAPEGAFPENTTMKIEPVDDQETLSAIKDSVENAKKVQAVDITFYNDKGREIEPAAPIQVILKSTIITETDESVVLHVDSETNEITTVDQAEDVETEDDEVVFLAESFSIYAIVGTEYITTKYITADGEAYNITVAYEPEAEIPEDAELEVTELTAGDTAYDISYEEYVEEAGKAIGIDTSVISYAKVLDIKIVKDGEKVQPAAPVNVTIELADTDSTDLNVVHFPEGETEGEVVTADTATAEENTVVAFEAEGFSVYTVEEIYKPTTESLDNGIFAFAQTDHNCTVGGDWHPQHYGQGDPPDWRLLAEPYTDINNINRSNATYWKLIKANDGNDNHYYMQVVSTPNGLNIGKYLAFTSSNPDEENDKDPGAGVRLVNQPQAVEIFVNDGGDRDGQVRVIATTGQKTNTLDLSGGGVGNGFDAWRNPGANTCHFTLVPMNANDFGTDDIPNVYAIESNGINEGIGTRATVESSITGEGTPGNDTMNLKAMAVADNYSITDNRTFWEVKKANNDAGDNQYYIRAVSGDNAGKYLVLLWDENYKGGAWRPGFSDTPDTSRVVQNNDGTYSILSGNSQYALDFFGGGGQDVNRGFGVWNVDLNNNNQRYKITKVSRNAITQDDPYHLDGKAFALVNNNLGNNLSPAIVTNINRGDGKLQGLKGTERGEYLYVNSQAEIVTTEVPVWRFTKAPQGNGYYYLEAGTYSAEPGAGGEYTITWSGQYLNVNNPGASVSGTQQALKVNVGGVYPHLNEYKNQICITNVAGYSLNVIGWNAVNDGIGSWQDGPHWGNNSQSDWFQLWDIEKIKVDEDPEFFATKISAQDIKKTDGDVQTVTKEDGTVLYYRELTDIAIYRSVFVPEDNAYEDFLIDGNGNLVKVFDKGSKITGHSNSPFWNVRIYYSSADGTVPTGYYDFYNPTTEKWLDPLSDDKAVHDANAPGVVLPEKDNNGKYSTRIEAWDDEKELYYGIYIKDEAPEGSLTPDVKIHTGTKANNQSEELSFARKYVDDPTELHPVSTVDTSGLINIKMYDFASKEQVYETLQGNHFQGGNHYNNSGIASMRLNANGMPDLQENGGTITHAEDLYTYEHFVGNANHLFLESVYASTGFYEYNAFNNYAYFNNGEVSKTNDIKDFVVYEEIGTPNEDSNAYFYKRGNFFPYNAISTEEVSQNRNWYDGEGNHLSPDDPRYNETLYYAEKNQERSTHPEYQGNSDDRIDWWFGMTMDFDFVMPENGKWNGGDMIYQFNGDDDLWIYIDGVKILDIGGDHDALPGEINFATGQIKYGANFDTDTKYGNVPTTIKECFHQAGIFPDGTAWDDSKVGDYFNGDTFKDFSSHSFKMIYAEQGGAASNLVMRFNLPAIPPGSFTVEKELDPAMKAMYSDREFEYKAYIHSPDSTTLQLLTADNVGEGKDITKAIMVDKDGNPITDADNQPIPVQIDANGVFKLKAGERAQFVCAKEGYTYDVVEVSVPEDVKETKVNGTVVAPEGVSWMPKAAIYSAAPYNGSGSLGTRYAPAGQSTTNKRALVTFTNKMTEYPLEIQKIVTGNAKPGDIFRFRVWLENQDGSLSPASMVPFDIYKLDGDQWVYDRSTATGRQGTLNLKVGEKAVIRGLMKGTRYLVIEDRYPEGYKFRSISSDYYDPWTDAEWTAFKNDRANNGWDLYGGTAYEPDGFNARGAVAREIDFNGTAFNPNPVNPYTKVTANNSNGVNIQIWKVSSEATSTHIGTAWFRVEKGTPKYVYADEPDKEYDEPRLIPGTEEPDLNYTIVYRDYHNVIPAPADQDPLVPVTKDEGRNIQGESGAYSVQEIVAPDGFIITYPDPVYFELNVNGWTDKQGQKTYLRFIEADGKVIPNDDPRAIEILKFINVNVSPDGEDISITITIANTPGTPLPVTGGPGTTVYTIGGMMLIMIAAAYAFSVRRRERRLNE